jgi:two-component system response regulator HydG
MEHAVLWAKGHQINMEDLPEKIKESKPLQLATDSRPSTPTLETIEKTYIYWVLSQTGWQKSKAASILGIDTSTLYRKIERYGLKSPLNMAQDQ